VKIEPDPSGETCPAYSHDGNELTDIKVEEDSDTQEEQDPLQITSPEIEAEYEVNQIYLHVSCYPELCIIIFLVSFCLCLSACLILSACMNHVSSAECILKISLV
jgi:hypothetical protein